MGLFGRREREKLPKERLEQVEDELRRLRRHVEDLEDTLTRRVAKLMVRARREADEKSPEPEPEPEGRQPDRRMAEVILRRRNGLLR